MSRKRLYIISIIATSLFYLSFSLPKDWFKAGSNPESYDMGIDIESNRNGKKTITIKSINKNIDGFGTLMQEAFASRYVGKRIRLSGYMKSENVKGWAGFWLRIDQINPQKPISFDNMHNRAIIGTTDWRKYEIILDVPVNGKVLAYGALLYGTGQIWFDDLKFEIVNKSIATTNIPLRH